MMNLELPSDVDLIAEHHEFPGIFPIKVFVRHNPQTEARLRAHLMHEISNAQDCQIVTKSSAKGNFVSMTIHAQVESAVRLREIYVHLKAHPDVLMTL